MCWHGRGLDSSVGVVVNYPSNLMSLGHDKNLFLKDEKYIPRSGKHAECFVKV